jgi:hypothetical protein
MIKCIRIDVTNEVVHEVEINDNIQDIYKQLGCDLFEVVRIDETNDIYVDEEGLLKLTDESKFFEYDGYPQPLSGNGLIFGHDENGNSISTTLTIEEVREKVKFLTLEQVKYKEYNQ